MASLAPILFHMKNRVHEALERSGRPNDSVKLIGVTKKQAPEKLLEAFHAGLCDFGENYVQEWTLKCQQIEKFDPTFKAKVHWHFIGHLQSNKAAEVVGRVDYIHTLDSLKLAQKVSALAQALGITQKVLVEVKLGQEITKHGMEPSELLKELKQFSLLPGISWEGLMAIPPPQSHSEKMRPYFAELKSLLDECNRSRDLTRPMRELSMGMSDDFEVAIEEGATMVRIGQALFGARI